ncbi:MAG: di-trans,poly-cis-decaprenylcistransferase [Candidatus Aenigmarchaeota archaeon]|nr:di-trans,poly-cis-decaprenylcistransferase [Candidatus Aenigmarchaeota archaeon]NIP40070.1 di-trans,poly-cis-decaprenylcistransferase [Candidatus Aenigmarchaeota archaeon]NIQ18147.1 di-trans,poly-cis-decaprenylcistransferase [Candidatus Aenigmarchaeota archaeon]NIS72904.1 di-trans,poly-cis-decaprenylcistransferase [Candidatus Aenigmarchaeota archaeon]
MVIANVPEHVGIIPDGNRRLARRLLQKPWKGHEWGFEKIKKIMEWSKDMGIKVLTFYTLSLENLDGRPKRELNYLFQIARKELDDIIGNRENIVHKNRVRLNFLGRLDLLPEDLQEKMKRVSELTRNYSRHHVNLAIAYGGRQEIIDASRRIAADVEKGQLKANKVNESLFRQYLWTNGFRDPDLIIRTGGEKRLSNFLPFQSVYSEIVFLDKFWPELDKEDFSKAIREFGGRERRFGR